MTLYFHKSKNQKNTWFVVDHFLESGSISGHWLLFNGEKNRSRFFASASTLENAEKVSTWNLYPKT